MKKDIRAFTIHVCPTCGYYDADPILRRAEGIPCFRCGQRAVDALDLSRVSPSFHLTRKQEARRSAPVMEPIRVVPEDKRA